MKDFYEVLKFMSVTDKYTFLAFATSSDKFLPLDVNHLDALAISQDIDELKKNVAESKNILKSSMDIKS